MFETVLTPAFIEILTPHSLLALSLHVFTQRNEELRIANKEKGLLTKQLEVFADSRFPSYTSAVTLL